MSQESTEQQIRELASAVGHGAGGDAMVGLLRNALQIPNHALHRPAIGADPGAGAAGEHDPDADENLDDDSYDEDLPEGSFVDLDLLAETMQLYRRSKRLMERTLRDKRVPSNQKAQTVNTLANLLKGLAVQQTELYNAERLKRLENLVITMVKELAPEIQDEFIRRYEAELNVR